LYRIEDEIVLDKNIRHNISVVVDRIIIKEDIERRLTDSIETALRLADGLVELNIDGNNRLFSEKFACTNCNISFGEIEPRIFSFNNPYGACPECDGLGERMVFDINAIVPDKSKSMRDGAIRPWEKLKSFNYFNMLLTLSKEYNIDLNKPFSQLSEREKNIILLWR